MLILALANKGMCFCLPLLARMLSIGRVIFKIAKTIEA